MKYSATVLAAAIAVTQAAPAQPVCKVITTVVTGSAVWVPQPAPTSWAAWSTSKTPNASTKTQTETWAVWDPSTSKTPVATSTESWGAWTSSTTKNTPVAASTTTNAGWGTWSASTPVAVTSTTSKVWEHSTTPAATTTTTTSYSHYVPTTTTTTTAAAAPTATCPAQKTSFDAGSGHGDCNCDYTTYCNVHVGGDLSSVQFWERKSGELINTLEECIQICDDNSSCTAAIWTDSSSAGSQDYKHCWQTNGLPTPNDDGYGQISYKGQCSGSCSAGYTSSS